ncbi:MAG: hypothetical protein C4B59_05150 [Candidatus Methanogaster sp.]|uniref:Uncharacterized protein n=1 Tax=Candidatus Methanogaster sp. TaxID=3386292 RepID=A0AC61L572_9EURY|nr:MAG: hypothetical protein C4B59_05150 [ANME-2 cluster archaeon]
MTAYHQICRARSLHHIEGTISPGTATRQPNHTRAQATNQINNHSTTMHRGTFRLVAGQPNS